MRHRWFVLVLALILDGKIRGQGFIRGDLNSDGRVTLSDAALIISQLFPDAIAAGCQNAQSAIAAFCLLGAACVNVSSGDNNV